MSSGPLRERVARGGAYLMLRSGLAVALSFAGALALARLLGPAEYGRLAGALAIVTYVTTLGRLGVDMSLVRAEDEPQRREYEYAFTLLLAVGLAIGVTGVVAAPPLVGALASPEFEFPLRVMMLGAPFGIVAGAALARLERALDYRRVTLVEIPGYAIFYGLGVALVGSGFGLTGALIAYVGWQVWLAVASFVAAGLLPRLAWSSAWSRRALRFGLGYSFSSWIWRSHELVNPVIVGRSVGTDGVGFVSLAQQFATGLAFASVALNRLLIAAIARIRNEPARLRRAFAEGMTLQVLACGPLLAGFALIASWAVPALWGGDWDESLKVFPFIALGMLVNALFNLHSAYLYVVGEVRGVVRFHLAHLIVFVAATLAFVPPFGIVGYGFATVAALATYAVLHREVARSLQVSYRSAVPWLVAFAIPIFAVLVPFPASLALWIPFAIVVARRQERQIVLDYVRMLRSRELV